ncbi:MAG: phosphotransferase [Caldilineaceae bacterium]
MKYKLYASLDGLLAPETITKLTGESVKYVRCLPMEGGFSGSSLLRIEASGEKSARRFVLKRMALQDWIMDASNDQDCRSVTLWQSGLLDRLQPTIRHAILGCAYDGDEWALLMDDVGATLLPELPYSADQIYFLLDALATLHATFWEAPELTDSELGLCTSEGILQTFTPTTGRRFADVSSPIPKLLAKGWPLLQELVAPDVVDVLDRLYTDFQPLCKALARYPMTLVHSDFRGPNLGIAWQPSPQTILFDWQLAGYSAATIDLTWFYSTPNVLFSPVTLDDATEYYRQRLAEQLGMRFNHDWWQPLLALGQLVNVLRRACLKAHSAVHHADEANRIMDRKVLDIYSEQVRAAVQWL